MQKNSQNQEEELFYIDTENDQNLTEFEKFLKEKQELLQQQKQMEQSQSLKNKGISSKGWRKMHFDKLKTQETIQNFKTQSELRLKSGDISQSNLLKTDFNKEENEKSMDFYQFENASDNQLKPFRKFFKTMKYSQQCKREIKDFREQQISNNELINKEYHLFEQKNKNNIQNLQSQQSLSLSEKHHYKRIKTAYKQKANLEERRSVKNYSLKENNERWFNRIAKDDQRVQQNRSVSPLIIQREKSGFSEKDEKSNNLKLNMGSLVDLEKQEDEKKKKQKKSQEEYNRIMSLKKEERQILLQELREQRKSEIQIQHESNLQNLNRQKFERDSRIKEKLNKMDLKEQIRSQSPQKEINQDLIEMQKKIKERLEAEKIQAEQRKKNALSVKPVKFKKSSIIEFPQWMKVKEEFQILKNSDDFQMDKKILAICKKEGYQRNEFERKLVAIYLQKQSFFKLMPLNLLESIAVRIKSIQYQDKQVVCNQGDVGDAMYLIYRGKLGVYRINKFSQELEFQTTLGEGFQPGRRALDTGEARNATLIASGPTWLLVLMKNDYQQCILKAMEIERKMVNQFVNSIQFFNLHFKQEKIDLLCTHLKLRFLAPGEPIFQIKDPIDNVYIIKSGEMVQVKLINLNQNNKWPHQDKDGKTKWRKLLVSKQVTFKQLYKSGDIIGYHDIVEQKAEPIRTEQINATSDCLLLQLNRLDFLNIFDLDDFEIFREHYKRSQPTTYEDYIKIVQNEEKQLKQRQEHLSDIVHDHIKNYSGVQFEKKSKQLIEMMTQFKAQTKENYNKKYPTIINKAKIITVNSMYD